MNFVYFCVLVFVCMAFMLMLTAILVFFVAIHRQYTTHKPRVSLLLFFHWHSFPVRRDERHIMLIKINTSRSVLGLSICEMLRFN